jgi:hypothetical protein
MNDDAYSFWGFPPAALEAVATCVAVLIAIVAASFAFRQVREARQLREDQAQPFVIVDISPSPISRRLFNLIIRNVGLTLAKNVKVYFTPDLESTLDRQLDALSGSTLITQGIKSLPPGGEFTCLFDNATQRFEAKLPNQYSVIVTFHDSRGRLMEPLEYDIDLSIYYGGIHYVEQQGIHDVSKTLKDMLKLLKSWEEDRALSIIAFEGFRWREEQQKARHGGDTPLA